jgi:hypothetical protein
VFSEQRSLSYERRHFEQAPRVDRPQPALCSTTPGFLPATQGQRSKDRLQARLILMKETID